MQRVGGRLFWRVFTSKKGPVSNTYTSTTPQLGVKQLGVKEPNNDPERDRPHLTFA